MTKEKEVTPRESMKNLTLSTLERTLIQETLGSNLIKNDPFKYGQIGLESANSAYNALMFGEEVQKMKQEKYQEKQKKYNEMGVADEPSYPSNGDISYELIRGLESVMQVSFLEDLEEGVKKVAPGLKYDLPEELKGLSYEKVMKNATIDEEGKLNLESLSDNEQKALVSYQIYREAYRRGVAMNIVNSNYFADLNEQAKQIMNSYKKEAK